MPIRASTVNFADSFNSDLDGLRDGYAEIDGVVVELAEVLKLGYDSPEILIDDQPRVYVRLLDYPPHGANGVQRFRVVYHATDPAPDWNESYRTYTLLTITERP